MKLTEIDIQEAREKAMKPYHETEHGVLYHGDCYDILPTLKDKSVDMILTDPPYGLTACKWDKKLNLQELWDMLEALTKESAAVIMTAMQPFTTDLINSNRKHFRFNWVWNKTCFSNVFQLKKYPSRIHEDILLFSKTSCFTFNPVRESRSAKSLKRDPIGSSRVKKSSGNIEHYGLKAFARYQVTTEDGTRHPTSIINISRIEKKEIGINHPTKKPKALFEYLIKTYSNPNECVLDLFAGSGTTAVACILLNRRYILIEKDEKYCEMAAKRIESEMQQVEIAL